MREREAAFPLYVLLNMTSCQYIYMVILPHDMLIVYRVNMHSCSVSLYKCFSSANMYFTVNTSHTVRYVQFSGIRCDLQTVYEII